MFPSAQGARPPIAADRESRAGSTRISIGKRLSTLVVCELLIALAVVVSAVAALGRLSEEHRYMHRYMSDPLVDIGGAFTSMEELEAILDQSPPARAPRARRALDHLRAFLDQYVRDFQVVGSDTPDAVRLRAELSHYGRLELLGQEQKAVDSCERALRRLESTDGLTGTPAAEPPLRGADLTALDAALVRLNAVNLDYMEVGFDTIEAKARRLMTLFGAVGLMGVLAAPLLGLFVRRAIAPRVAELVERVGRFRELGLYEPLGESGMDDIAVLARALDVSFAGIVERDKKRELLLASERAARAEAERANQLKDDFLATVSHELRTPLNAVLGWAELLQRPEVGPEKLARGLGVIARNGRALETIIADLLDTSRMAAGKVRLEMARESLPALVEAALDGLRSATVAKRIEIHTAVAPLDVLVDATRFQQVIWNLVSNAIKFTPEGGRVTVAGAPDEEGQVVLRVSDTGEGIDAEFLPHVFERFRQADASPTRRHGGLGLGLSIVQHLVELHGGAVCAHSEGRGRGAVFTVTLPSVPAVPSAPEASPALPPGRPFGG
jgi:signal transduction histidine kinase